MTNFDKRFGPPQQYATTEPGSEQQVVVPSDDGFNSDSYRDFVQKAGNHKVLSREEELLLVAQVKAGVPGARDKFLAHNYRLVFSLARQYYRPNPSAKPVGLLDLIQEGIIGMMHALEKFEPKKGYKFSTYSTWWIRQSMQRYVANNARTIRVPVHLNDAMNQIHRVRQDMILEDRPDLMYDIDELEKRTGQPRNRIIAVLNYADADSLDFQFANRGDGEGLSLHDIVPSPDAEDEFDTATDRASVDVSKMLDQLPKKERTVIELRYGIPTGEPWTLEAIGKEIGVTRERVRQLENQALKRLKEQNPGLEDLAA
jgi:RNA polymerase sigma factor (sigma-70 family)